VNADKAEEEDIGEATGLASVIFVLVSKSRIYRCCESKRASFIGRTSTPRKLIVQSTQVFNGKVVRRCLVAVKGYQW
jgi:hypothetical protein